MTTSEFLNFDLKPALLTVIQELGFQTPTPIQLQGLPLLLAGQDVIGQSKTGSGKTATFVLPILNTVNLQLKRPQALILCPTRELANQVTRDVRKLGRRLEGLQVLTLSGGSPSREQSQALLRGVHIVVGTPGRVLDLLQKERFEASALKTLVLDEADKMLDMGFEEQIHDVVSGLPLARQTVFFSATFSSSIKSLSAKYQKNPQHVEISQEPEQKSAIEQLVYEVPDSSAKNGSFFRILQQHPATSVLVFCNMKVTANDLYSSLHEKGVSCSVLHGELIQRDRDRVMAQFRNGSHRILIATDVAARGLDIAGLDLVINFDLPSQSDVYLHRVGRTGRADKTGVAVSLALRSEAAKILEIEAATGQKMERPALGFANQYGLNEDLRQSPMKTLMISAGRKDKIRPGDILGALTNPAIGLKAADVGQIEIQDRISYVAISATRATAALAGLRGGGIKGQKISVRPM